MNRRIATLLTAALLAVSLLLLPGCTREYGDTDEYRAFLQARAELEPVSRTENADGYSFVLEAGTLFFLNEMGRELWRSDEYWYVEDFCLFDVDGDGNIDCLFSLWKSYSFYRDYDADDDPAVRNHLFLYTVRGGYGKALWSSSNLPRPIYSFAIEKGVETPASTGAVLYTTEGAYTEDFSKTETAEYRYVWQGWGFAEEDEPCGEKQEEADAAKVAFAGDLMVHSRQLYEAYDPEAEAYDFTSCFADIQPYLASADYAVGNLETVLASEAARYTDYPAFNTPDTFALALREAGFTMLTTANNHCNDRGEAGILRTLAVMDELGLDHVGTYDGEAARDDVFLRSIGGIEFAFLAYTEHTNGLALPDEMPWLVSLLEEELVRDDIQRARAAGAEIVVVLPHMGVEYESQPGEEWEEWAHSMLEWGADIVVASHPHVLQPVQLASNINGTGRTGLIAYSTGNLLSSQREVPTDAGLILNLYFERASGGDVQLTAVSYVPTWVKFSSADGGFDIRVLPVWDTLQGLKNGQDVDLSEADVVRIEQVLDEQAALLLGQDADSPEKGEFFIWNKRGANAQRTQNTPCYTIGSRRGICC